MEHDVLSYFRELRKRVEYAQEAINAIIEANTEITDETISWKSVAAGAGVDDRIFSALLGISESLARSYAQIKEDLRDYTRLSWAGTAHEIRELLATMLRLLAPDSEVVAQPWYKQVLETSGPTQKQRVRYILQGHGAGSKERQVVEQVVHLEDMIENLVRSTYARASDAAHRFKPRGEVVRICRYFEAFAYDLLNLGE